MDTAESERDREKERVSEEGSRKEIMKIRTRNLNRQRLKI